MSPKRTGSLTLPIMVVIGIFGVLASILALQGVVGSEWNAVASGVASAIVIIGCIAFVIIAIVTRK